MPFPSTLQRNQMDCGPTCLYIICNYYKVNISIEKLRELTEIGKEGVNMLGISDAAEKIGFKTLPAQCNIKELTNDIKLPAILHWGQQHFVVLYKASPPTPLQRRGGKGYRFYISDPAKGLIKYNQQEFEQYWLSSKDENGRTGVVLTVEPSVDFYNHCCQHCSKR